MEKRLYFANEYETKNKNLNQHDTMLRSTVSRLASAWHPGSDISFVIPHKTELRYTILKKGKNSKKEKWAQKEGVPCKIVKRDDELFILNSFASDPDFIFQISHKELEENFTYIYPTENGFSYSFLTIGV